jgi:hypothetical protein
VIAPRAATFAAGAAADDGGTASVRTGKSSSSAGDVDGVEDDADAPGGADADAAAGEVDAAEDAAEADEGDPEGEGRDAEAGDGDAPPGAGCG